MQENSPLLQLQNVGYLAGDAKILNNINFSLRAGEFKLITGPSGCGKSTLLKIVASLISPTSGMLLFEGEDVSTLKPEIYRQQVSYCAQTPTLFGDTVYDNLIFPWQIRNQQPDPAIFLDFLERFALPDSRDYGCVGRFHRDTHYKPMHRSGRQASFPFRKFQPSGNVPEL